MSAASYSSGNFPTRLNKRESKVVETSTSVASADATSKASAARTGAVADVKALLSHFVVGAIVATNVSQTVDFGALAVADVIVHIPAVAGNSEFVVCATVGTLPVAAVVGDLYLVLRAK
jgi:hypothetical protein